MVTMPPRHGKSETITVRWPVRELERHPGDNVLVTGYNERFARRFGRKARNVAKARGMALDAEKAAADEWATQVGGVFMTRGVGSPPTGVGFRAIVIDDPIRRREDAESVVYREKVWDWYTDDLYTRLEPGGAIVVVMTRWHEDDLAARALESERGRWHVLNLPAISESGAALWPERYPIEALERIRSVMRDSEGERSFEALYQQHPTPREGALFKIAAIGVEDAAPAGLRLVRAWDLAASVDGDFTVGVLMGRDSQGFVHVVDVVRGRWGPGEVERTIRATAERDGVATTIRLPQDPGQAGKAQVSSLTRTLAGFSVRTERVTGDKQTRAFPLAAQVEAGNVRMVRASWNASLLSELRGFPLGAHDDQVDAAADAFNELLGKREIRFL